MRPLIKTAVILSAIVASVASNAFWDGTSLLLNSFTPGTYSYELKRLAGTSDLMTELAQEGQSGLQFGGQYMVSSTSADMTTLYVRRDSTAMKFVYATTGLFVKPDEFEAKLNELGGQGYSHVAPYFINGKAVNLFQRETSSPHSYTYKLAQLGTAKDSEDLMNSMGSSGHIFLGSFVFGTDIRAVFMRSDLASKSYTYRFLDAKTDAAEAEAQMAEQGAQGFLMCSSYVFGQEIKTIYCKDDVSGYEYTYQVVPSCSDPASFEAELNQKGKDGFVFLSCYFWSFSTKVVYVKIASGTPPSTSHTVSFSSIEGGTISGQAVQTVKDGGDCSPVSAVPNDGFVFDGWTGGFTGSDNPLTVKKVAKDISILANFSKAVMCALTMETAGQGTGVTAPATGVVEVPANNPLVISATADSGCGFKEWQVSGAATLTDARRNSTTATLTGDATITAVFIAGVVKAEVASARITSTHAESTAPAKSGGGIVVKDSYTLKAKITLPTGFHLSEMNSGTVFSLTVGSGYFFSASLGEADSGKLGAPEKGGSAKFTVKESDQKGRVCVVDTITLKWDKSGLVTVGLVGKPPAGTGGNIVELSDVGDGNVNETIDLSVVLGSAAAQGEVACKGWKNTKTVKDKTTKLVSWSVSGGK